MVTVSVIAHLVVGVIVWTSPRWLPRRPLPPPILVVDLVTLPPGAGALSPPARKPAARAPEKKPSPTPTLPKPEPKPAAVKLPDAESKPAEKPKPVEPQEPKPEPAAVPQPAADEAESPAGIGGEGPSGLGAEQQGAIGALDEEAFEFAWYRQALTQSLRATWEKPDLPNLEAPLRATVHFRVRRNGQIVDIRLEESSGLDLLDRSALRSVYDANPLPPLPYAYDGDSLGVHFYFELTPQ